MVSFKQSASISMPPHSTTKAMLKVDFEATFNAMALPAYRCAHPRVLASQPGNPTSRATIGLHGPTHSIGTKRCSITATPTPLADAAQ